MQINLLSNQLKFYGKQSPSEGATANNSKHFQKQQKVLKKLLLATRNTEFGIQYSFPQIVESTDFVSEFQKIVPVHDYSTMKVWWQKCLEGESNVVTNGKINYFALSSGTSDGSSKYVPVSDIQVKQMQRKGVQMLLRIARNKEIPASTFGKHNLLIGGSTDLNYNGINYSGDLSGIAQLNLPFWYNGFSKPEPEVMRMPWDTKINNIVLDAPNWNVSIITGIPSWVQIVLEKIVQHYHLKNIHELWPDLKVYIHSGIRAEPYYNSINKLFGDKVFWYNTYLASEGFLAFNQKPDAEGMKLILNGSIFFEFIPFNESNFDDSGDLKSKPQVLSMQDVDEGKEYALVITTCSGAWRYMIGDTVQFTNLKNAEIIITGRTKHFLSVTGEHLSIDNMIRGIGVVAENIGFTCKEFTVFAEPDGNLFIHHWYIGCNQELNTETLKQQLDAELKLLNDDYKTERQFALKDIVVNVLPNERFYEFLRLRGKAGGQVKFPRVLKGQIMEDWKQFLLNQH